MKILVVSLFILNIISFYWAFIFYFKIKPEDNNIFLKSIKFGGALTIGANLFALYNLTDSRFEVGSAVLLSLSAVIFWLSIHATYKRNLAIAFTKNLPHTLVTDGIYSKIRHPFYLSYTICWFAGGLYTQDLFSLICALFLFVLYIVAAKTEEKLFQSTELAGSYTAYKKRSGMFLPRVW